MITYTWNGQTGSIGINSQNPYVLQDKEAFGRYYMTVKETLSETRILKNLLAQGVIRVPEGNSHFGTKPKTMKS